VADRCGAPASPLVEQTVFAFMTIFNYLLDVLNAQIDLTEDVDCFANGNGNRKVGGEKVESDDGWERD
jgi:hypothetical protein